jgi:hypothetical protein
LSYEHFENSKHQKSNIKQISMTEYKNTKQGEQLRGNNKETGMFGLLEFRIWILPALLNRHNVI